MVLYGSGMGPGQLAQSQLNAAGNVDTTLAGTRVFFNGAPAPCSILPPGQVGAVAPFNLTGDKADVVVTYQDKSPPP